MNQYLRILIRDFLLKRTLENALLKQQINNYKCITSDLRTKVKDLENEKDSLVTVIKILHDEQNQHANKSIASWNVVNNHKRSKGGRGSSKNYSRIGPSSDIRDEDGATQTKYQYIVLWTTAMADFEALIVEKILCLILWYVMLLTKA